MYASLKTNPEAVVKTHPGAIESDAQIEALLDLILEMSIERVALEAKKREDEKG